MQAGSKRVVTILWWIYFCIWIWLAIKPLNRSDWMLENLLLLVVLPWVYRWHQRQYFSTPAIFCIIIFLSLHAVGSHHTYSEVPLGHWVARWFAWERNPFDRWVHFAFGLLITRPLFELLCAHLKSGRQLMYCITFCVIMAAGAIYELMEWGVALIVAPNLGNAFLGAQGDGWDAQKDLALKMLGALLAWVLLFISKHKR